MPTERETNLSLFDRYKSGDDAARDEIINNNLPLVKSIAKRFYSSGRPQEDIFQTGVMGLIKAIEGYDSSSGFAFSTYAFSLISGEIRRYIRDDGIIKVSRKLKKNACVVLEAKKNYFMKYGKEPHISELCLMTSLSKEDIADCLEAVSPVRSIFEPASDNNTLTLAESVIQDDVFSPIVDVLALRQELYRLDSQQRQLINLRFYKNLTQSQAAKILGISQVSVSRLEKKAISQLKKSLTSQ